MTTFDDKKIWESPRDIIILRRTGAGIETNVPHFVTHHSPGGYEWGYEGSGPADLALNILEGALRGMGFHGPKTTCWRGQCYQVAWKLHQEYKREVIARVPDEGTVIKCSDVEAWLMEHSLLVKDWIENCQAAVLE